MARGAYIQYERSEYHTACKDKFPRTWKEIFDLTAGVYFNFLQWISVWHYNTQTLQPFKAETRSSPPGANNAAVQVQVQVREGLKKSLNTTRTINILTFRIALQSNRQ